MTPAGPRGERRRPKRRRSRFLLRTALVLAAAGLLFGLGIALGRTLEENRRQEGRRTLVRTLQPVTVAPEPATLTVTVTR